jgi:organic hydroperoxide reductase OsmC/OhrA
MGAPAMVHEYKATVTWKRGEAVFSDGKYSRAHEWSFDGGVTVLASSSPLSVRLPYSRADAVDPEEAFVAALSSCHMLTFVYLAQRGGYVVDSYVDEAVGIMTKNERGKLFVSKVALRPRIAFSGGKQPSAADLDQLHHRAHEECYIANSVLTEVVVEPVASVSPA